MRKNCLSNLEKKLDSERSEQYLKHNRGVFSMGAMDTLENRLLAPIIFGHFSNVGKNCGN